MRTFTWNQVCHVLDNYRYDDIRDHGDMLEKHGLKYFIHYMAMRERRSHMETDIWVAQIRSDPNATQHGPRYGLV